VISKSSIIEIAGTVEIAYAMIKRSSITETAEIAKKALV
jgi:hypothetical protein